MQTTGASSVQPAAPAGRVRPWRILRHPLQTAGEIAALKNAWPGALVVLVFGVYLSLGCYRSYLNHDYPPPPDELRLWIDTWGAFSMLPLPFLPVPLEQYRLFMALIALPVAVSAWLVMAGIARLIAGWSGVETRFYQYLNLFAFSFYPFWLLSALGDGFYSAGLGSYIVPGLLGQYGPLVRAFFVNFPPMLYTTLFTLAAVYNGLAAYGAARHGQKLRWWQATLTGWLTFLVPLALVACLFR